MAKSASSYFKDRNFLTNEIIRFGFKGPYVYELSEGRFLNSPLYGVTLANRATGESLHDQSRCFESLRAAECYIGCLAV